MNCIKVNLEGEAHPLAKLTVDTEVGLLSPFWKVIRVFVCAPAH